MNTNSRVDYIIVGQGLAGSAVALQLIDRGKNVKVFDSYNKNSASRVAAGLFNPVTGKRPVRTWMADILFPYLEKFYRHAEALTRKKFFHPMPVYRPFASVQEQNEWMGKSADENYAVFLDEIYLESQFSQSTDVFGGLMLRHCGYLNTNNFLNAVREFLQSKNSFSGELFDTGKLVLHPEGVTYAGVAAKGVIFCEGERALRNPLFPGFPIRPLKGETLLIKTDFERHVILNRGVYMVPDGVPGQFKIGATYRSNDQTQGVSAEGRQELEEKVTQLLRIPFEIVGDDWGVRPTTADHKPLLGHHPEHKSLIIFNGLGTKGVSLAPYFSDVLIRWLEKSGSLADDVILTRYK